MPTNFPKYWRDFLHAPAQDGQVWICGESLNFKLNLLIIKLGQKFLNQTFFELRFLGFKKFGLEKFLGSEILG